MDALAFLKKDHQIVEALFKKFESAGPRAHKVKRRLVDEMIVELSKHAAIEEQWFYPALRKGLEKDDEEHVLEALEEHHVVKWTLEELLTLSPEHERFDPKVSVLMESVRHHVEEEEQELFPKVKAQMEASDLTELGKRLEQAKKVAPTRPHPRTPDSPPGNLLAAPIAAVVDRGRDALKALARGNARRVREGINKRIGSQRRGQGAGDDTLH